MTKRLPRQLALIVTLTMLAPVLRAEEYRAYVGTYTSKDSKGIYTFELDTQSNSASEPRVAAELVNPSFLAFDPTASYLYAVAEVNDFPGATGKGAGGVVGFRIDKSTGELTKINSALSGGGAPCHLSIDKTGKVVVAANYGGGSVIALPIGEGGKLGEVSTFIQHEGKSVNRGRQEAPHAHAANVDPTNKFVMVNDLGCDKIFVYKLDAEAGKLTANDPPSVSLHPGAGPRHFSFHPNGKYAYCNNEMQLTATAFSYDSAKGVLSQLGTWTTVPDGTGFEGNSTAECLCHPSGKFVYVSNRGPNSIAIFQVQDDGTLKPAGFESTQGEIPRNFGITPDGKQLLAANQNSGTIVFFAIDQETGDLTPTGKTVNVPSPVCVRFLKK